MFWLMIFGIVVLGLVLILLDILFIPGAILGIIGGGVMVYGIFLAYMESTLGGSLTLLGSIVMIILAIYFAIRSKTWNKVKLNSSLNGGIDVNMYALVNVGDAGTTISRLMPMGKARFNGHIVEVASIEGTMNPGENVEIVKIEVNKIYVKPKN
jgi:membrane-bound ClpP family serine protease